MDFPVLRSPNKKVLRVGAGLNRWMRGCRRNQRWHVAIVDVLTVQASRTGRFLREFCRHVCLERLRCPAVGATSAERERRQRCSVWPPLMSAISKRLYRHISQEVCPWNVKFAQELRTNEFRPRALFARSDSLEVTRALARVS